MLAGRGLIGGSPSVPSIGDETSAGVGSRLSGDHLEPPWIQLGRTVRTVDGATTVRPADDGDTGRPMSAPLNLVNLERVHKAHGTTVILDDVSLGVAAGERIGVVGRNGGGKSTLLSLLTGADEPDSGRVTRRGDLAMGVLDQSGTLPPGTTVRDVVLPPSMFAAEHEWAGDPAVRSRADRPGARPARASTPRSRRCPVASGAAWRWPPS